MSFSENKESRFGAEAASVVTPSFPLQLLLVEDDLGDAVLVQELLSDAAPHLQVTSTSARSARPRSDCPAASTASCSTSACPTPSGWSRSSGCAASRRTRRSSC